ncbi:maleylpyruvate isomerase family mycothiol-dependent enzyme [Arthrobacter oryzae]|uniref:Maleylpyruvate isomerase family mycothiol-dependent enzyme n=1 Tax=Arthrobacter oryzae TaxID=409290 RepID=A0A3N0C1P4_9MICC|nr:maleylpyruvate isomerase family mycothiol-dependent enzyme [Arthrobacter oryzae]RNL55988.1 maleylpyruvate isomerase family mycothiol-dependent enzyme [Arthrobacter oryzae]
MSARLSSVIWPVVHSERLALIQDLESLPPQQWEAPSLCPGWDVHDVVAHLVDTAKTTRLGFLRRMMMAGFDFDRDNALGVARERTEDPGRTLAGFRAVVDRTSSPPAPLATRLVEAFVHGEDIRRAVGIERDYPTAHVITALRYQLKTPAKIGGGKERAQGWRLVASEAAFEHGTGHDVRGTAKALLLAVSGRPVMPSELTGAGAEAFTQRARP